MATIEERVARGARLLDAEVPSWAGQINKGNLYLGSCVNCIFGQIYGHYASGLSRLCDQSESEAITHGFQADQVSEYPLLTTAWLAEIRARLAPDPAPIGVTLPAMAPCPTGVTA